ncbi:unnamed protein product [Orchesella dallaii]|uniref:Vps72/YL1 N-terminal domain-containing protein n=1 Tax=Orchesella dallaii TaxID=48710 RepID=A0ABP1QT49_9HEXA
MSLASSRSRRAGAGSQMARLLNEEEEDEFYSTTYGGFKETEDDRDYTAEKEEEDVVDSDFDIDEDEEVVEDGADDDDDKKTRRGRIVTKAYVDPKARKPGTSRKSGPESPQKRKRTESESEERQKRRKTEEDADDEDSEFEGDTSDDESGHETDGKESKDDGREPDKEFSLFEPKPYEQFAIPKRKPGRPRRSSPTPAKVKAVAFAAMHDGNRVRSSTKLKSQETESRLKERKKVEARRREKFKTRKEEMAKTKPLTQEELLLEAEETAKINIESLEKFQRMELEKKKQRSDKIRAVPTIRYHSFTVPLFNYDSTKSQEEDKNDPVIRFRKYERTLLSFSRDSDYKGVFDKFKNTREPPKQRRCIISGIKTPYFDPLLQHAYFNRDIFKVLRAAYNRIMYQKGDKRIPAVRTFCEWLEQQNPETFNREKLLKLTDTDDNQAPVVAGDAVSDGTVVKTEETEGEKSGTPEKKTPKTAKMPPLTIKAGSRTRKSVQSTSTGLENADDKGSTDGSKPLYMYRPPTSRLKQLPNAKRREVVEPVVTPVKVPAKPAAPAVVKQKATVATPKPHPSPLISSPVTHVKTYGPAKSVPTPISTPIPIATPTTTLITAPISSVPSVINAISTTPMTSTPSVTVPLQLPTGLTPTGQPRHVLIARRNLAGPLMVASSGSVGVPQTVVTQKSQPIVIRNVTSNQLQQSSAVLHSGSPIQIPTSTVQLAVSGAGGAGSVAFLNLRGNMSSVLRGVQGLQGLTNISGSQVVRLLQQQGVQFIQQTQPLQQSTSVATSGNPNLPVTVRLPVSSTIQLTQNPTSAALCSTASAIVAANSSAVRLAARSGTGPALQVVASRPLTGTNTVVARGSPIPASVVTTGNRMAKPTVATVRTPGGALRPTTITGVRTTTLTASQLRSALSAGTAIVRTTPGTVQGTVVGTATGNVTTVRATGSQVNTNIRAITIPTTMTSMARPIQGIVTSTMTASSMVRPLTISTQGARPVSAAGVRQVIGNANTIWQQQIVTTGNTNQPGTRLVTVPVSNVRPTASSLVAAAAAAGGGIRIARRPATPGSAATTLLMPMPRQSVASSQVTTIGSPLVSSGGQVSIVTPSPMIVTSEAGVTSVVVSSQNTHFVQTSTAGVVTLNTNPTITGTSNTPSSSS